MLYADLVIRPHNGTLQQAPDALNAIGVNVAMQPFFFRPRGPRGQSVHMCNLFISGISTDKLPPLVKTRKVSINRGDILGFLLHPLMPGRISV